MTFTAAIYYVYTFVLVAPSLAFISGNFCREAFEEDLNVFDAYNCSKSKHTDLTTDTREWKLEIVDGTEEGYTINIDEEFSLRCCFYSQPYCPLVRWYKDGVEITRDDLTKRISEDGRELRGFAKADDGGTYACYATTPYRGERLNYTFAVSATRTCNNKEMKFSVETAPDMRVVSVKKGSRQVLVWNFLCWGNVAGETTTCRTGEGRVLSKYFPSTYYNVSDYYPGEKNAVSIKLTITIFNFSRSENITCGYKLVSATFTLVEKECKGNTYIFQEEYVGVKMLRIGENYTMTCTIFCLRRRNFNDPVWRNGRGELITNNSVKFLLNSRDLTRDGFAHFSEPSYEMSLTVININRSENFSCYVSEGNYPRKTFSLLIAETEQAVFREREDDFFNEKGVWMVIGGFLLLCFVVVLLCYRIKVRRKSLTFYRPNKEEVAARYDAFISYSEADGGSFVRSTLKPMLEDECGYTLSLHYREFVPGTGIIDNIIESIYHSRRIVTVVTPEFLKSEWCQFEVEQGLRRAIEKPNTLVVVMLEEIPRSKLPKSLRAFLTGITFLLWDEGKHEEMRKKLKSALGPPFTVEHVDALEKGGSEVEIALEKKDAHTCHQDNDDQSNQQDVRSDNEAVIHEV